MSSSSSSSSSKIPLRRSARTVCPVVPFQFEQSPPTIKRKRPETYLMTSSAGHLVPISTQINVGPPISFGGADIDQSIENVVKGGLTAESSNPTTKSGIPLTTYSNCSLDTLISQKNANTGRILQKDLEDLNRNGTSQYMTVKEMLAKNFKNYRTRQSFTSDRAMELVKKTLTENDVPKGALLSGPPIIPPDVGLSYPRRRAVYPKCQPVHTIESALESLVANAPVIESIFDDSESIVIKQEDCSLPPLDPIAYPGNHLPWPVFWKSAPEFVEETFGIRVDDVTYTPISDIMKAGRFEVPLDATVGFIFNEKPVEITLNELLMANGINLTQVAHYRQLQSLLEKVGVHFRADYADRLDLMQMSKENARFFGRKDQKSYPPLRISLEKPLIMCTKPEMYASALGRRIHGAILVDSSGEKEQIPGQTFLTTIYSEPVPFEYRRQILILHDVDIAVEHIAARFDCTENSVKETIGTRILIERHLVDQYLLDEKPDEPSSPGPDSADAVAAATSSTIGEVMRPRSKIRRTHYVDLNKLVWNHFKECQNAGIQINGKQLKDQAMRFAREMGLDTFRGSEGWLDAFKRRHRIDLKTMTGFPVCYENDMYDEVDREGRDEISPTLLDARHHHQNPLFLGSHPNHVDDFTHNFFHSLTAFPSGVPEPARSSNHLQNMINSMMTPHVPGPSTSTSSAASGSSGSSDPDGCGEGGTILNVMRSCQIKVADKEVSHAFDTIRAYILAHDPGAMTLLLPLMERLSALTSHIAAGTDNSS